MSFDFKKEYKQFYLPPQNPVLVEIPEMNFIAVRGQGNPNQAEGAYQKAIGVLYGVAYTLKMSARNGRQISGFFDYVVPPLEGFWWQEGTAGADYASKGSFRWVSLLRLPDFVQRQDFDWAVARATEKKKLDCSAAEFFTYREGLCVQCMHLGPYDDEPATIGRMDAFAEENGYQVDITLERFHHEIYITPNKGDAAKMKTVVRHPVKPVLS